MTAMYHAFEIDLDRLQTALEELSEGVEDNSVLVNSAEFTVNASDDDFSDFELTIGYQLGHEADNILRRPVEHSPECSE